MLIFICCLFLSLSILVMSLLAIFRENIFDKFLCLNVISNLIIMLITCFSIYKANNSYIDIAYIYVLTGFIGIVMIARYYTSKN